MEKIVKEMLHKVIESKEYEEQVICQYFSPQYEQVVDHTHLNFEAFKKHIKKLKQLIESVEVQVLNYAVQDHSVFTKHKVYSILKDGSKHTHKVFAEFILKEGKIIRCEELTLMIEGSETAKHLGSLT